MKKYVETNVDILDKLIKTQNIDIMDSDSSYMLGDGFRSKCNYDNQLFNNNVKTFGSKISLINKLFTEAGFSGD